MYSIRLEGMWFSAAHRVEGHPKCGRLHGHNYEVIVELGGDPTRQFGNGMIVDFGDAKREFKNWIDENLDHRYLVSQGNLSAGDIYHAAAAPQIGWMDDLAVLPIFQTTAELMAEFLHRTFSDLIFRAFGRAAWVISVTVRETPTSYASFAAVRPRD